MYINQMVVIIVQVKMHNDSASQICLPTDTTPPCTLWSVVQSLAQNSYRKYVNSSTASVFTSQKGRKWTNVHESTLINSSNLRSSRPMSCQEFTNKFNILTVNQLVIQYILVYSNTENAFHRSSKQQQAT